MFVRNCSRAALAVVAAVGLVTMAGCSSSGSSGSGSKDPHTITFASIPEENSSSIANDYKNVIAGLEKKLGVKVKVQQATSYAAVIEALRAGQVDVAALGPFSYTVAKDGGAGVRLLGVLADAPNGAPTYQSYAITKPNSGINSIKDMAHKKICFVDPTSTSGYLFPSAALLKAGINPETGVSPVIAGGHDASVLSVLHGNCDAGFAYDDMVDKTLPASGQLPRGAIKVIWKSEEIPQSPTVVSTKLSKDMQDKIVDAFTHDMNRPALVKLGACSSENDCKLPSDSKFGYVPIQDSQYNIIRKVCDETKSKACVA